MLQIKRARHRYAFMEDDKNENKSPQLSFNINYTFMN